MANGQEKEIKLVSTPAGRKKLLQLPLVKEKLIAGSRHELALVNRYYDTRDQKLTRTGMAYRIRRTNGKAFEATVKNRGETVNGFSARQEYTVQLEKEQPVLVGFAPQMDEKLQTLLTEDELLPLFTVEFTRKVALLQLTKSTVVEVAVDTGSIQAGDSTEPIEGNRAGKIKKGPGKGPAALYGGPVPGNSPAAGRTQQIPAGTGTANPGPGGCGKNRPGTAVRRECRRKGLGGVLWLPASAEPWISWNSGAGTRKVFPWKNIRSSWQPAGVCGSWGRTFFPVPPGKRGTRFCKGF